MASKQIDKRLEAEKQACIWMQAGVVRRKFCRINYQCAACRYDMSLKRVANENRILLQQGITPAGKRAEIVPWRDRLRELPTWKQPCVHSMKQHIEFRTCTAEPGVASYLVKPLHIDELVAKINEVMKP